MIKPADGSIEDVPYLSTEQMIEVDRAMIEDYQIGLVQMMESAGRNLAHLARKRFLGGFPPGKRVVILAGSGGNGGGAMVCARRLTNWGAIVDVRLARKQEDYGGVPAQQLRILERMDIAISTAGSPAFLANSSDIDLVVDGVIGYSLSGPPRGPAAEMIRWANDQRAPTLALDTPSGLDAATGKVFVPAVKAAATLTLALPKQGLRLKSEQVGELYLADISVPPDLYERYLGIKVGILFAESEIVRLP